MEFKKRKLAVAFWVHEAAWNHVLLSV